jgi:hypothetical protein
MIAVLIFMFSCISLLLTIVVCETQAMKKPKSKFSKWWRKYVVVDSNNII